MECPASLLVLRSLCRGALVLEKGDLRWPPPLLAMPPAPPKVKVAKEK